MMDAPRAWVRFKKTKAQTSRVVVFDIFILYFRVSRIAPE